MFTDGVFSISENYLSTKESLWVFGENNEYNFFYWEKVSSFTRERAPEGHADYKNNYAESYLV